MEKDYSISDKCLIMSKFFIKGLSLTAPYFFTNSYIATIASIIIGLFIARSFFSTLKEEVERKILQYIMVINLGGLVSGMLFGGVWLILSTGIYNSYVDLFWGTLTIALLFLISSVFMSFRLKLVWNLQNDEKQIVKKQIRRSRKKFGVKLNEDDFKI